MSGHNMQSNGLPSLWGRATAEDLAELTGAHITTARRWKRQARPPAWLERLVCLALEGELGEISPAWRGWRVDQDKLISPEGWSFRAGEIRSLPFLHSQIASYQALQRIPAQADLIEGNWERLPGAMQADAAPRPSAAVISLRR